VHPDGTGVREIASFENGSHCICADWSPDGKRIAYQAGTPPRVDHPEIWVMNADGTDRVQLTRNRTRDENPDWSPDGKRIAFYSERTGNAEVFIIPATGGQARRVTHEPWYVGPPRWHPLGMVAALSH
jgi:TolB protein